MWCKFFDVVEWTVMVQLVVSGVRNSGEILVYGALDSFVSKVSVADLIFRDVRVHGWYVTKWIADLSLKERQATGAAIMDLFVKKVLRPHIGENYPLSKFKEAIAKSQVHNWHHFVANYISSAFVLVSEVFFTSLSAMLKRTTSSP